MKIINTLFITAILATGCKSYDAMQGYPQQKAGVNKQIRDLSKEIIQIEDDGFAALEKSATKEADRNSYILKRVAVDNLAYAQFVKKAVGIKNGVDAGKDIAVGAMGAAGAIVGGNSAQILSAAPQHC